MFNDLRQEAAVILIVDDQPSNVLIVRQAVKDLGEVHFATSGKAALDMLQRLVPDVVLLDIEMPEMDGYAVCAAIKANPRLHDVPVIFVTSHHSEEHELQALSLGGVDFLHKPLNVPVARARIQTHLALRRQTRALALARRNLEDVVHHLPAFIAQWNTDLCNLFSNDEAGRWFGVRALDMQGMHMRDILGASNYFAIESHLGAVLQGQSPSFELVFTRPDGMPLYGQASLVARDEAGYDAGFLMLITDVTERKLAELALYDEKERIRVTLNSIGDAVIATDAEGRITFLNPIAEDMTGWQAREAIGLDIERVMPLKEGSAGHDMRNPIRLALLEKRVVGMAMNCALVRRDGQRMEVEDSAAPIWDHAGQLTGAIIVFHDVSEARAMLMKMTHLANHDALTNLPNRMLLQDRMEQALYKATRSDERVALLILDLDHFKTINDSIGHSTGDQLLQEVARRLKQALRGCDTVSRQGGDEFVILLPELDSVEQVGMLADRLLKVVSEPYQVGANRYDLSVSIGVSLFPDDASDIESLYRHADGAMYRAKQQGRNRFLFFSSEIEDALRARHMLERHMRLAVEQRSFEVFYQPKVDALTRRIIGAEALVRWRNDDGQLISPAAFIPLAEETGLIVPLGQFVMRQACLDAVKWHASGLPLHIAVNVSAVQIEERHFVEVVREIIGETGIAPSLLELEITEGVLAKDTCRALETIAELKSIGVSIAIDDFGTGYSSLAYLKQFPIDVLKIDQSFVRDMLEDNSDAAIIEAIINMANSLGLRLVAEGVETEAHAQALLGRSCQVMQGYLYGRPMPYADMCALIARGLPSAENRPPVQS